MMFDPAKHSRQNTLDFKPPKPDRFVQWLFRLFLLPLINQYNLKGLSVEIDAASLQNLKALKGQRCLILSNHPSEWDPCVLFDVSRQLQENFFFVAAREVFDYTYGLRGWLFQKLGVYSLVRGYNDRKSLKTSIDILAENRGRLVIFIEGEISNQNETLLPVEPGVIQLAFMALNDCYKENGKNLDQLPSLYICPMGLFYNYNPVGIEAAMEQSIQHLEDALGINKHGNHFDRILAIANAVLEGTAEQLGFDLPIDSTLAKNVKLLSGFMLSKLERVINIEPNDSLSHLDRIREIRNTIDKVLSNQEHNTPYAKRLQAHQRSVLKNFYADLGRVVNFIAIHEGYLKPDMPHYIEILRRLEKEVFGQYRLVHPRKAIVTVAEPIDLKPHFEAFLADKKTTVTQLASTVEKQIYQSIKQHSH
jgi:1-acyl-sn-glycerol-3-phosphate acyltransferase